MARLAQEFENIVGIKDSSTDLNNLLWYQRLCPPGFQIFTGQDTLIVDALVNDGAGAVSGLANVVPTLTVQISPISIDTAALAEAKAAQRKLLTLRGAYSLGTFPVVVKEMAQMIGLPVGPARRPVRPLSPEARTQLRAVLANVGVV